MLEFFHMNWRDNFRFSSSSLNMCEVTIDRTLQRNPYEERTTIVDSDYPYLALNRGFLATKRACNDHSGCIFSCTSSSLIFLFASQVRSASRDIYRVMQALLSLFPQFVYIKKIL